jgi:hypothetical protein
VAEQNSTIDEKGERGGDTGKTKAPKHGEKGDQRRDKDEMTGSVGATRPGGSGSSRSGSKSNQSK